MPEVWFRFRAGKRWRAGLAGELGAGRQLLVATSLLLPPTAPRTRSIKMYGADLYAAAKEGQITEVSYMFPKPGRRLDTGCKG
jgi:hypothetical protein